MNWFRKRSGFTLLELMIVVIIIGILASLAIPRFIAATNRARKAAATEMLSSIRSAQMRYFAEYSVYATDAQGLDVLDLSMTTAPGWTLSIPTASGTGDNAIVGQAVHGPSSTTYTVEVDGDVAP